MPVSIAAEPNWYQSAQTFSGAVLRFHRRWPQVVGLPLVAAVFVVGQPLAVAGPVVE